MTAGHCLRGLDGPIRAGTLKVSHCVFADYFGDKAVHRDPIPFTYEPGCGFCIDDETQGFDFGVIKIGLLTIQALEKNGVRFVGRENWINQPGLEFERYIMLGVPSHLVQGEISDDGVISSSIQPVMVGVDRLDPNSIDNPLPNAWFVGRLDSQSKIESIEGMSGGPIYGFRRMSTGQWGYHVVALQSRWRPKSRTIFGCSVPLFAEALHNAAVRELGLEKTQIPD